jgi:hypothetical protein
MYASQGEKQSGIDMPDPFSPSPTRKLAAMIPNFTTQHYLPALKNARH